MSRHDIVGAEWWYHHATDDALAFADHENNIVAFEASTHPLMLTTACT